MAPSGLAPTEWDPHCRQVCVGPNLISLPGLTPAEVVAQEPVALELGRTRSRVGRSPALWAKPNFCLSFLPVGCGKEDKHTLLATLSVKPGEGDNGNVPGTKSAFNKP